MRGRGVYKGTIDRRCYLLSVDCISKNSVGARGLMLDPKINFFKATFY